MTCYEELKARGLIAQVTNEEEISKMVNAVDSYIPTPTRDTDKPFLMPVEDVFTITGRGTVATGRVERGQLKLNDPIEIVGIHDTANTVATGIEMFRKLLDYAEAGDNVWQNWNSAVSEYS